MTSYRQSMKDTLQIMYDVREASLLERDLTPDEEKRREEIAKDLPDDDFKNRYGDKWMSVKMATATKMMKKEEFELDEAKMSASQIAALKKAYEPMRGKKISMDSGKKLSAIMDKVDDDKQALIQLVKADIPFVSSSAVTRLISKHGMKGAEINKLKEEVELDEATYSYKAATFNGNVVKGTGKTKEAARKDAENKAKELGSTIRKRLPEETNLDEAFKAGTIRLKDGKTVKIDKMTAESLNNVMKQLNSTNRKRMETEAMKDKDSFDTMVKFAMAAV